MDTFACGHDKTPENSSPVARGRYQQCAFCARVRKIARQAKRDQERINAGRLTIGERVMRGLA